MIGATLLDRYQIVGELGRGGMGVVYRARDPLLGRDVAVKLIPPALLTAQTEERFRREAQLVAQMNHPSIVTIFDIGRHEGSLFFLMPVVEGTNLRQFLREKPRSLGQVLDVITRVAEALDYSHRLGVVHRDIKPENIMVAEDGESFRVFVMDFGLAKASSEDRLTKTGTLVGTISYFSPEQVISNEVDGRSDIYSLGTVLYECLSGEPPFTGEVQAVLYRIAHENPRSLRATGVQIGEELEEIVLRTLAKDPAKRFQRAGELAKALELHRGRLQESDINRSVVLSSVLTAHFQRPAASPFIGRDRELAELQRRLNAAVDGTCQFVVIAGEPGVGKTRLLEELESLARVRKIPVLHGRFTEQNRAFAYQGFREVIQEYFRSWDGSSGELPDFSDLAPDLIALFPVLSEISQVRNALSGSEPLREGRKADDRTYVFELLARTLARIGGAKPLFLILENLQGAEMSLDALEYVVQRLAPTPTLICATYRQTEIDKRHPLVKMLDAFRDEPTFSSLILGPFTPSEHRRLVEMMVESRELAPGLAERLYEATDANPFFTKELVRSLIESGGIARDERGAWTLSGEMAISSEALPATIQQTVEKRIERLPEDVREVLSVASVLGKTFDLRDLEALAEGKGDIDRIADRLIIEGLLEEERESRGDRLTFSSGIVRDVLYNSLSRRGRRSHHRRYAELLEKQNQGRLERVYPQLVLHFSEGDVPEKTVEYGLALARKSLEAFSADETVHVIRTVLEFLKEDDWSGDRGLQAEARLLLAAAFRIQGNVEGALREAELAVKIFEREKRPEGSLAAMVLAADTAWQARRAEETRRWIEQGLEVAHQAGETQQLARLLSLGSTVAHLRGDYQKSKEYLDELERVAGDQKERSLEEDVPEGGTLSVALANPVAATTPDDIGVDEESEVLSLVYETLVNSDDDGHLVPSLAEKWEVLDGGRSVALTLRRGVRFHDGAPLTAASVKSSFERSIRSRRREMRAAFTAIRGVDEYRAGTNGEISGLAAVSESRLEIALKSPLPTYPALLTDEATAITHVQGDRVTGTGPFQLPGRNGDVFRVERGESHWRLTPPLEAIDFRIFPSAAAIAAAMKSGEVDIARDLLPRDLEEILRDTRLRAALVEAPKKNTYFVIFNCSARRFPDEDAQKRGLALHRAMFGAVRVRDLVWQTLGRLAQPAAGLLPPGVFGHDPGRRRAVLSREDAQQMLRSAGVPVPVRLRAAVHPLLIDRYRALTAALLETWKELGIEVVIGNRTFEEYLAAFDNADEVDLLIGRWNADYDDPDNFSGFLFNSRDGVFTRYYSSAENDRLFEEARAESSPSAREALYRRFENQLIDNGVLLPLFHDIDYRVASPAVRRLRLRSSPPYVNYAEIGKSSTADRSAAPAPARAAGGTIHVPVAEDIQTLDPARVDTIEEAEVISTIFQTITHLEGTRVVPWLAARIDVEEGGRRYRVILRDNVRFHDGRRLTPRDVRYSWERLLTEGSVSGRYILSPVVGVAAVIDGARHDLEGFHIVSNREFTLDLESPLTFFPAMLSFPSTAIVPEGTIRVEGNWRAGCVGTGPFRLVQFRPGGEVELERNPSYWRDGYPKSDGIIFHLGVSPEEIRSSFRSGRFSLASDLYPADVEAFRQDPELAGGYRELPRLSTYFVAFNVNRRPFTDAGFRRRLLRGLDVPAMVRRTLGRLAIPANGVIPPGLLGHRPAPPPAASASDADVRRSDQEIEVTAAVHPALFDQYGSLYNELARVFRSRGLMIRVVTRNMAEYKEAEDGSTDIMIGRWVADYPDADTFAHGALHSRGGPFGKFVGSPELDQLMERGRAEIDPGVRHAIYRDVEEILAREALILPLFHEQIYRFGRPEVAGLTLNFAAPEVVYEDLHIVR